MHELEGVCKGDLGSPWVPRLFVDLNGVGKVLHVESTCDSN